MCFFGGHSAHHGVEACMPLVLHFVLELVSPPLRRPLGPRQGLGSPRSRQIFLAKCSSTSRWRGTEETFRAVGLR